MKKLIAILFLCSAFCSCARKWTDKDKSEFVSGCLSRQVRELGQEKARTYCNCLLNKVVARYPDANDAKYIQYDSAIVKLSQDCLPQP
jgi:hypothetical protein